MGESICFGFSLALPAAGKGVFIFFESCPSWANVFALKVAGIVHVDIDLLLRNGFSKGRQAIHLRTESLRRFLCPSRGAKQKQYIKQAFHNGYNNGFIYITPEYAICNNPSANLLIILRNCNIIHVKVEGEQYSDDGLLHCFI